MFDQSPKNPLRRGEYSEPSDEVDIILHAESSGGGGLGAVLFGGGGLGACTPTDWGVLRVNLVARTGAHYG